MAQLREIRRRIRSIKKTQQVTRAMKMVAAARLRRAQEAILHARPYASKIRDMIEHILTYPDIPEHPLLRPSSGQSLHLLVISGDRGLCGNYNSQVFREVEKIAAKSEKVLNLTIIGRKGVDYFSKRGYSIHEAIRDRDTMTPLNLAHKLFTTLSSRFLEGSVDQIAVTYTEFKSALSQRVVTEWLLPMAFDPAINRDISLDYIFDPNPMQILNQVLPRFLQAQIFRCLLESRTSEFGARMTAMDSATRNSADIISHLTLQYNQARQATITKELIEVVSGAEALKG